MTALIQSAQALSQGDIAQHLGRLRQNALIEHSHFAVAAMLELILPNGHFAYVCGVNVENSDHNRLSLHAEQNALAAAQSLFGAHPFSLSKAWVMGGPDTVLKDSEHPWADQFVKPCGHCRQILLSFSSSETDVCSINIHGKTAKPERLTALLPDAFDISNPDTAPHPSDIIPTQDYPSAALYPETAELNNKQLRQVFKAIMPRVIDAHFCTSDILACIIRVADKKGVHRYFQGALVQDIAFLSTDAVFASVGLAITELGGTGFVIRDIHLYGVGKGPRHLSGSELRHLVRFSNSDTRVIAHSAETSGKAHSLRQCVEAYAQTLLDEIR